MEVRVVRNFKPIARQSAGFAACRPYITVFVSQRPLSMRQE